MSIFLYLIAGVLIWFGFDALRLSRHASPVNKIEKDEMMFGKGHRRPVSDFLRSYAERRYPFASGSSTRVYVLLFFVLGVMVAFLGWSLQS
jgi:hypothetical protein